MNTSGKVITCRAAVHWKPGKPASIENIEVAAPKAGEIRIKMAAAGICYSDVSLSTGRFPLLDFPVVLGHEGVGVVESVGVGVSSFKAGDTVIPVWAVTCGQCVYCKKGKRNICDAQETNMKGCLPDGTTRLSCKATNLRQGLGLGVFSEYIVVPEMAATKVTPCSALENLTPYGCCMPTGYGAAFNTSKVEEGAIVAVWGLGAVGLCAVLGSRDSKAARIIGIDINPEKFEIGRQFGCTETLNPQDYDKPVPEILMNLTNGVGVDYAFVCVGNADAMTDAFKSCSKVGECVIIGVVAYGTSIPIQPLGLVNGKTLKGSTGGDCRASDISKMVDMYHEGKLPTDKLITGVISLDEINTAFDLLKSGKAIRSVIVF